MEEIVYRKGIPEDRNHILSTWLMHYYNSSRFAKGIKASLFYEWHQRVIERIFNRGAHVLVAALAESPDIVLAYLVYEMPQNGRHIVHFIYVKEVFRSMGIARELFKKAAIDLDKECEYTHQTYEIKEIRNKYPRLLYNPYLV